MEAEALVEERGGTAVETCATGTHHTSDVPQDKGNKPKCNGLAMAQRPSMHC